MKIINIDFKRLKEIVDFAEEQKRMPIYIRTYKINSLESYYLRVLFKKEKKENE